MQLFELLVLKIDVKKRSAKLPLPFSYIATGNEKQKNKQSNMKLVLESILINILK